MPETPPRLVKLHGHVRAAFRKDANSRHAGAHVLDLTLVHRGNDGLGAARGRGPPVETVHASAVGLVQLDKVGLPERPREAHKLDGRTACRQ